MQPRDIWEVAAVNQQPWFSEKAYLFFFLLIILAAELSQKYHTLCSSNDVYIEMPIWHTIEV